MMALRIAACALAVIVALITHCTKLAGGAGGETTNGVVTGAITDIEGSYCAGTVVRLFPAGYDPIKDTSSIPEDTTATDGNYTFSHVPQGEYAILARRPVNGTRALITGVHVGNDTYFAPTRTLLPPGSIKVFLPSGINSAKGYIYIPGTSYFTFLNNRTDFVVLDSISADSMPAVSLSSVNSDPATVIRYGVLVLPCDTAVILNPSWSHARRIVLNTSVTGANVTGMAFNFPVLIRLNRDMLDFSQVRAGGADLRFAKPDNTPLACEIERWDPVAERAEVWVKVDTILGNDSVQSVLMYWGNTQAQPSSNGSMVFGAADGFIGVWHLDSLCSDASGNHYDGANFGAADTSGLIGGAMKFNGRDSIRISGLMGEPASLTLSGWVNVDTTVAGGQEIVTIGDAALIRSDEVVGGYGTGGYAHQYTQSGDTSFTKVTSGIYLAKTGWRYVAFVFDNTTHSQILYIDGVPVRAVNNTYAIDYTGVGSNTFIGAHGNNKYGYNSRASIDEVRVCGVARSADWVKLCYMNQRMDDKLIAFK